VPTPQAGKNGHRKRGLRYKLIIIEALLIVLPALILIYLFGNNRRELESFHIAIIALTLILVLAGLLLLREIFDRFTNMASLLKKGGLGRDHLDNLMHDMNELREISTSFNALEHKLSENFKQLQDRSAELAESNAQLQQQMTERKRAEKELEETNQFLSNILDSSVSISIISTDLEGNVLFWNKGAEKIFGYRSDEMVGRQKIGILYQDEETRKKTAEIRSFILENKKETSGELRETSKSGEKLWIKMNLTPSFDEKGEVIGILGIGEDITKSKQLEEALHLTQKMEAIGTLAGGAAHDFNNLLMAIQGNTSLLLMETDPAHPHYTKLENIIHYVKSGSNLTSQLLGFARGGKYKCKPTDMNRLIHRAGDMFSRTGKGINIQEAYQDDLWAAEVDEDRIGQVLLNLFVNAEHAMPEGGDVFLQTGNVILDENYVHSLKIRPGRYVKISVTDTGVGMDQATQQRIFEPFFTTKERGRGTGLGLASVYGIVKKHGGRIDVDSEKGLGTTFHIYLPASERDVVEEADYIPDDIIKGEEIILLVDHENMIPDPGYNDPDYNDADYYETLDKMGYTVLTAKSARDALDIYAHNHNAIDLIILDGIMPDMDGGEIFDRLKQIDPETRVLLSSGVGQSGKPDSKIDSEIERILTRGCDGFIWKPFTPEDLSRKIRTVLDRR